MSPLSEGFLDFINSHNNFTFEIIEFVLVCFGFLFVFNEEQYAIHNGLKVLSTHNFL